MKVSVVSVTLNAERTVARMIESFLGQTHPSKELLIIDGLSGDRTLEVVSSFGSDLIRVLSEKDGGVYDAMNKGLRLFTGDAVGFLGSDDTFHSNTSLTFISEGLRGSDIVFGDLHVVSDGRSRRMLRNWRTGEFSPSSFRLGWIPPHPTFYIRRHVVEAVGEFDVKYRIAGDYDYMLRAMTGQDFRMKYVPHVLVDYRLGGSSSASLRNILTGNFECLDSRRRHLGAALIDAALFLRPIRRLQQLRWFRSRLRRD